MPCKRFECGATFETIYRPFIGHLRSGVCPHSPASFLLPVGGVTFKGFEPEPRVGVRASCHPPLRRRRGPHLVTFRVPRPGVLPDPRASRSLGDSHTASPSPQCTLQGIPAATFCTSPRGPWGPSLPSRDVILIRLQLRKGAVLPVLCDTHAQRLAEPRTPLQGAAA